MKVFVYGTLKKGYGNNERLLSHHKFVETKEIKGYKLYDCGFPVARKDSESSVLGEVWDIGEDKDTLYFLDRLEGEGRMYNRVEVEPGLHMYVGHPEFWEFSRLRECPKKDNKYYWSRDY